MNIKGGGQGMPDHRHISVINEQDAELLRLNRRVIEESQDLISSWDAITGSVM